jgi:hypothetical protein
MISGGGCLVVAVSIIALPVVLIVLVFRFL